MRRSKGTNQGQFGNDRTTTKLSGHENLDDTKQGAKAKKAYRARHHEYGRHKIGSSRPSEAREDQLESQATSNPTGIASCSPYMTICKNNLQTVNINIEITHRHMYIMIMMEPHHLVRGSVSSEEESSHQEIAHGWYGKT